MRFLLTLLLVAGCAAPAVDLSDCANVCLKDIPAGVPVPPPGKRDLQCEHVAGSRYTCEAL